MVLILSILFFSVTVAFASDSKPQKRHINIVKTVNGQTMKIDTTFTATDEEAERIVADINKRFGGSGEDIKVKIRKRDGKDNKKEKVVVISVPDMNEADHEKLKSDIEKALDEMDKSFSEMGKALNDFDFNFNFNSDEDSVNITMNMPDFKIKRNKISIPRDLPDSLKSDDRIIVEAEDGEEPPVFEKSVKGESGKTYFIYKRKQNESAPKASFELTVFPNPANGKFAVKVNNPQQNDILIKVTNDSGKEVYRQLLENIKGEYQLEIDLGSRAKGNYIVSATAGTKQVSKKIVIQ